MFLLLAVSTQPSSQNVIGVTNTSWIHKSRASNSQKKIKWMHRINLNGEAHSTMLELNPGDYFSIKQGWESAHPWDAEDIEERLLLEKNEGSDSPIFYWKSIEKINNGLLKQPDNQKPQRIETHQTNQVKHLKVWCLVTTKEVDDANPCRAKQSNQALSHLILPSRSSMSSSSFWLVTRTSAASGMVPSSMSTL